MRNLLIFAIFSVGLAACAGTSLLPGPVHQAAWSVKSIPATPQTPGGDPEKGFSYVISGSYIGSGPPLELVERRFKKYRDTVLRRTGPAENLPWTFSAFPARNGVMVANGNCLTCHAGELNGQVVIGLGNSFSDFRLNMKPLARGMQFGMKLKYGKKSPEWAAYEDFGRYFAAAAPAIRTTQPGVNPAAHLAEACASVRNPADLTYQPTPLYPLPEYTLATDVPPLWNVRKKNALYYTAVGRGDFTKLLFQASVLGIPDSAAAREAVTHFKDVVAWLKSLDAPRFPQRVDAQRVAQGQTLFMEHCASCHGTYGEKESYPNKVVALEKIGTDPYYARYAVQAPIVEWYNKSWFAFSEPRSFFEPEAGYVAPPLNGIWATAPYLHNGSVPTLEDLLNSKQRPKYWQRSRDSRDYDLDHKVGWRYTTRNSPAGRWTYDTSLPGYSNSGHTFGDGLSPTERKAIIEYLKTL